MQAIANAPAINNPEVKLMVVLVDERPEEVTDFERSAKGEVIIYLRPTRRGPYRRCRAGYRTGETAC